MTTQDKERELRREAIANAITDKSKQDDYINMLAGRYDSELKQEERDGLGYSEVYDKAYHIMSKNMPDIGGSSNLPSPDLGSTTPRRNSTKPNGISIPAEQAKVISSRLKNSMESLSANSLNTRLSALIFEKPAMDVILAGINTFKVGNKAKTLERLNSLEEHIVNDADDIKIVINGKETTSRERFNMIKNMLAEDKDFEINKSTKLSKLIGVQGTIAKGTESVNETLTTDEILNYIIAQTDGFIQSSESGAPGATITTTQVKKGKDGKHEDVVRLRILNRQGAIDTKKFVIATEASTEEKTDYPVRSALTFRVYTYDSNGAKKTRSVAGKNVPITRTICVTGRASASKYTPKQGFEKFGITDKSKVSKGFERPQGKDREKLNARHTEAIAILARKFSSEPIDSLDSNISAIVKMADYSTERSAVGAGL